MIFSDRELSKRIERTEALTNADFVETRKRLSPESCAKWIEVAGAYALFDGIQSPCTQTFGLGMFDEVSPSDLNKIEAFFEERNAPVLHEISPLADASLLHLLHERRYRPLEYTNVLFLPLKSNFKKDFSLNPNIGVRMIEADEVKLWAETSAKGWISEMPDFFDFMTEFGKISASCENSYPFLAEIKGQPIATGALFIIDGVAVPAGASTIPEGRKQGAQTALLDARLRFASEKGCDMALMAASPGSQSQKNAEKNGFRIAYTRTKWKR